MRLRVATMTGDAALETVVARSLGGRPDIELVMRCVDRVEALAVLKGGDLDAAIAVGEPQWLDFEVVDEAARSGVRLVAMGVGDAPRGALSHPAWTCAARDATPAEIVRRCIGDGAPPPPPPSGQPMTPKGMVVAIWGPKGAPGRTTIALEIARQLAALDSGTILVDGDPYGGDVAQAAEIVDDIPTVVWAAQLAARQQLHAGRVVASLRRAGEAGPIVLPGVPRGDLWGEVSPYGWRQLIGAIKAMFVYSVFDTGFCLEASDHLPLAEDSDRNLMTRASLEHADRVVAVCRADEIGVKNFVWAFDALTSLVDPDIVSIVANRVAPGDEPSVAEVLRREVGKRPIAYLPIQGKPRRSRRASDRRALASGISTVVASIGGPVRPRGLLTSLAGRS